MDKRALLLITNSNSDNISLTVLGDNSFIIRKNQVQNSSLTAPSGSVSFPKLTSIGTYGLYYAFYNCTGITSVSFPELTSIGPDGLESVFYGCTGITGSVSFPKLTSIGFYGLRYAFYNCTGITGSVSFPKLTSIGYEGLYYAFYNCTGITAVHFPKALSGNSQCTASNMGCTNATVYFDL